MASQKLPFDNHARATAGQLIWVSLNQQIDWDERRARVHPWCVRKLEEEICEVCHKPFDYSQIQELREQYGDLIYVPGEELDFENMTDDEKSVRRAEIEALFAAGREENGG